MAIIYRLSVRKNNSTTELGQPRWSKRDGSPVTFEEVRDACKGKRVCTLKHGYNSVDPEGAYAEITLSIEGWYDIIIWEYWPGSHLDAGFHFALYRVPYVAEVLDAVYSEIHPAVMDREAHSLGCMIEMETAKRGLPMRNLILTGAAIQHDCLENEYYDACRNIDKVLVAFSRNDGVLAGPFRLAEWDAALGQLGPEHQNKVPSNVLTLDVSDEVPEHSKYKVSARLYTAWEALAL